MEEKINHWSHDAFDNEDTEFADQMASEDYLEGGELSGFYPPYQKFFILSITLKGKQIRKYDHKGEARVFQLPKGRGRRRAKNDEDDDDAMQVEEIRSASCH